MSDNNNLENTLSLSGSLLTPALLPVSTQPKDSATQATTPKPPLVSIGDLISQVFGFYKKHWKLFLQIFVWPAGLSGALLILTDLSDSMIKRGETDLFVSVVNWTMPLFWLLFLIASVWSGVALVFACKEPLTWQAAYRLAWPKFWSYLWLVILAELVIMGGIMCFVVPGIIFSLWFAFPAWILVFEGLKGRDALLKSKFYVQGYWWAIFGRSLLFSLLLFLIIGGVMLPGFLLSYLLKMILPAVSSVLMIIWQCLASLFFSPLSAIFAYLLYQDVKNKKSAIVFEITRSAKKHLTWWALWGLLSWPVIILAIIVALIVLFLWQPDSQALLINSFYG